LPTGLLLGLPKGAVLKDMLPPCPVRVPPALVLTDAQAAIRRMQSDDPGPGQKYAIEARRWIAALRKSRPEIVIETRWCPANKGVEGNEKADEWAKLAAEEPDSHGVEWLGRADQYGRRLMPPPRSLANLKREISERKWTEAHRWVEERIRRNKYTMPEELRPSRIVDRSAKRLARRFYQLKTGHCLTGQYLQGIGSSPSAECGWCSYKMQTREHLFKNCPRWKPQQRILWAKVRKFTGRGKSRFRLRDRFADERCARPILDFLRSTKVGRRTGPKMVGRRGEG
jgi:hypothetical protein